jgi:glycosyltransferase involved in cell wall biosynthesis
MHLSVIVPAFNEERELGQSLRSIRAAMRAWEERAWSTELIVCDNNSTDRTAEIAGAAGARVVFEPVNQIARARNTGAAHATGDWLVFVDADSHPSAELFEDVASAIESGRYVAGGSTVTFEHAPPSVRAAGGAWNAVSRIRGWVAGSFVFCQAAAFRDVGGFSLELYAGEEIALSRRLKRLARSRGLRLVILHAHPLVTIARKANLYRPGEMLGFLVRTVLTGGRSLRSPEACFAWYDGRR